jgi:hypothetical protein
VEGSECQSRMARTRTSIEKGAFHTAEDMHPSLVEGFRVLGMILEVSKGHRILPSVFKRWFDGGRGLLCQCSAASFGADDGLDDYVEVCKVRREHVPAALAKKSHLLGGECTLVRHNGDCVVQVGSLG